MDGLGTFDRLAAELTLDERRDLLRKLESQALVSNAPLFSANELPESVSIEHKFRESSFFLQLWLRFLAIFKRKTPLKLFEELLIARVGASVEARSPGLFDYRRNLLLDRMHQELLSLKESSRFFYEALDGSVVREKGAFFAFLASLELDVAHRRLQSETDPYAFAATNSQASEAEIRQSIHKALESILSSLDETQRAAMYRNVRSLLCLKELASFFFDRALGAFSDAADGAKSCPAYLLVDQLMLLNDILFSLEYPPSLSLLESLFVFDVQDRLGTEDFQILEETRKLISRAEEALTRIRQFNQRVPLTAILRCASRNLEYLPSPISGGEDWFSTYREFWRKRIDERFALFVRGRRKEQLEQSLGVFFGSRPLPHLDAIQASSDGLYVQKSFVLIFLFAFYRNVFLDDLNKVLKTILLEGEFYKKENRVEFTDAYNELLKLGDSIQALDRKLLPAGDYGVRYEAVRKEMLALPLKRRKLASLQQEADSEAFGIVERSVKALRTLANVLDGILAAEGGGRYDTLSNLGSLAGRGTNTFLSSLRNAVQKVEKTIQMLNEIESLEPGR